MTTLCLLHRENEKCGFKKNVKNKIKSSNEEFINEVH
jgi:hypothetical protein